MNFSGGDLEEKIKTTLISSATYVFGNIFIRTFLERMFGSLSSAYVLSHTPDQGEDFYVVLVNGSTVVKFEISRESDNSGPENFSAIDVDFYRKKFVGGVRR